MEVGRMSAESQPDSRGRVIFFVFLILIGCIAIFYPSGTGTMGIEERFSAALGNAPEGGNPGSAEAPGFSLEGQPVAYILVLVLLGVMCWMLYRKFGA
jgi:hypothetical protein